MARRPSGIIALITDYSYRDPYVGAMKGVILSINPRSTVVDITHEVSSYDISEGAYMLLTTYREYPEGTVFVVVVDPGVGSSRRGILVETKRYYFVGPDNGVLRPAIDEDGIERVVSLTNERYFRKPVSHTFHGRDIFAPVAAHITLGVDPGEFGEILDPREISPPRINMICEKEDKWVKTNIMYIDHFGDIVTGCRTELFERLVEGLSPHREVMVRVRGVETYRGVYLTTFSLARPGEIVVYPGSTGFIEVAVYMSSFARKTNARRGDEILLGLYGL